MSDTVGRLEPGRGGLAGFRLSRDDRLERLAAAGDERAFAAIFRKYHQEIYRYCRAIVGNATEAEDALQATMVKALRSLPGERREIALKPWLYRVAHNEAVSIARSRRPQAELDPETRSTGPEVAESVAERARVRQLFEDLAELPERQRAALVMRELSGTGFDQIAASFGISPGAAKQTVYEARLSLQEIGEGREMECDAVRRSISDGDRRVLRGRRIRAHLRACGDCRAFGQAIGRRRGDLAALAPPLAVPAALAGLHAALASTKGGVGLGAGAAGGAASIGGAGLGGALVAKSVAGAAALAILAGGAAQVTGVIDLGGRHDRDATTSPLRSQTPGSDSAPVAPAITPDSAPPASRSADPVPQPRADGGRGDRGRAARRHGDGGRHAPRSSPGQGAPATPSGGGNSNAGGQSAAHSNAGGQSASASANAHGANPNAGGANAGGQSAAHANAPEATPSPGSHDPAISPSAGRGSQGSGLATPGGNGRVPRGGGTANGPGSHPSSGNQPG